MCETQSTLEFGIDPIFCLYRYQNGHYRHQLRIGRKMITIKVQVSELKRKKRLLLVVCDVFGWQSQRAVSVDVQDSIAVVCRPQEAKYFDFKHVAESSLNIIFLELDSVLFGALH